jgi:stage V sporulation protein K
MSDNSKYSLIKLGMATTILAGVGLLFLAIVSLLTPIFPMWGTIVCAISGVFLLGISEFFKIKRNKYRDIVEYDENGISKKYGNFSNLSNQERKIIEQQKMMQRELLVDSITLKNITHKGAENPDDSLEDLIGLEDTKMEIKKMAARMKFEFEKLPPKERKKKHFTPVSSNHMCFIGPPGTGKTTCARIMTGFLYKYHYIKKNQYIEIDGNFFNGGSLGESTQKAEYILGQASGGVLFIDEAYALMNSYSGQEAIATIVKHMEDNRSNLILIFAGYEKEMRMFIDSNSGLESRIKYWLHFGNYKSEELWQIFLLMAKQNGFSVDENVKNLFLQVMLSEIQKQNYGNARTVRNVLDKTIDQHAYNLIEGVIAQRNKNAIVPEDICLPVVIPNIPKVQTVSRYQ